MEDKKLTTYSEFIKLSDEIGVDKAYEQLSNRGFNCLTNKKDDIDSFLLFWRERFGEDEKVDLDFVFDKSYPHMFGERDMRATLMQHQDGSERRYIID